MKKLKILLQFHNFSILVFLLFTIVFLKYSYQRPLYHNEKIGIQELKGTIREIQKGKYSTKITVNDTIVQVSNDTFKLGEKVLCKGTTTLPSTQKNFYLFDYPKYLASLRIYYLMDGECEVVSSPNFFYQIKNAILKRIVKMKSYSYLNAFLLGNTKEIRLEARESYQVNGISHLFAVSGMHIGFFFLLFQKLFKNEKRRIFFLFFFLLFFLFLTNFSPSVLRASLFFFFSKIFKKIGYSTIQSFLLFTMMMLWYQPYFLYHTGFLYSFTISFFLLLFSNYIQKEENYLKKIGKISLIAYLASLPVQIQTNFSINLLSVFYNLLFVPVISEFLFPFSFLVFLIPILDNFYFFLLSILENISIFLEQIPSSIVLCHMSNTFLLLYYSIFLFSMNKIVKSEYKYIVMLFFFILFHFYFPKLDSKGMVLMMDVGQGDSTLIVYPRQKLTLLVDTGGSFYDSSIAENIIIPTLHAHGIQSIDYLILTHGDLDHVGEALPLLEKVKVKKVILNSGKMTTEEEKIIHFLQKKNISYEKVSKKKIVDKNEVIQFINSKNIDNENEDSLVSYLNIKGFSILLMGDSGVSVEEKLLKEYNFSKMDILKVAHHGSKYSTSVGFIEKINPKFCLISAGENNRYGHPHKETLSHLQSCDTYITCIDGAIKISLGSSMHVTKVR